MTEADAKKAGYHEAKEDEKKDAGEEGDKEGKKPEGETRQAPGNALPEPLTDRGDSRKARDGSPGLSFCRVMAASCSLRRVTGRPRYDAWR